MPMQSIFCPIQGHLRVAAVRCGPHRVAVRRRTDRLRKYDNSGSCAHTNHRSEYSHEIPPVMICATYCCATQRVILYPPTSANHDCLDLHIIAARHAYWFLNVDRLTLTAERSPAPIHRGLRTGACLDQSLNASRRQLIAVTAHAVFQAARSKPPLAAESTIVLGALPFTGFRTAG